MNNKSAVDGLGWANSNSPFGVTLGVFGDVPHRRGANGEVLALEPYVREMRVWADLFERVEVHAPEGFGTDQGDLVGYQRENVEWCPIRYSMERGRAAACARLCALPRAFRAVSIGVRRAGFVLLRSPSQLGLLGAIVVRMGRRPSLTKWAGRNGFFAGQSLTSRLDLAFQWRPSLRNLMLVYGPARRAHQISFIPALMSGHEIELAWQSAVSRSWNPRWELLCVARLAAEKRVVEVVEAVGEVERLRPSLDWRLTIVGDGPERGRIEALVRRLDQPSRVRVTGALPFSAVQQLYARAHLLVQPNPHEGWGKVLAEAWAHGVVPVAPVEGIAGHILRDPGSGFLFSDRPHALRDILVSAMDSPERLKVISSGGLRLAMEVSLENFKTGIERVLVERCGLRKREVEAFR